MHKKYHKKFKILDILAVTTQAREGIDTLSPHVGSVTGSVVEMRYKGGADAFLDLN